MTAILVLFGLGLLWGILLERVGLFRAFRRKKQ